MIQDLVNTLRTDSVIADLNKTREFSTFSEEYQKTKKCGRSNCFELGEVSEKNTVPVLRQILSRRTFLHFRNMFIFIQRTEAQKQTNILKSCQFPHKLRKKDYPRGAEQGRSQEQCDHFKANESAR